MKYEDLLTVPYKEGGRDKNGMDCYGLVLELCKRNNKPIQDFLEYDKNIKGTELERCEKILDADRIDVNEAKAGDLIEYFSKDGLHLGYVLDKETIIHMTNSGVRITPKLALKSAIYFRINGATK